MFNILKDKWCKITIALCFFLVPLIAMSQPGDPGEDPDNPVPIGGVEVLLIAGGALGIRKMVMGKKGDKS